MNGCKNCPAYAKCTITDAGYRGSRCAALRWTYGLDSDPEIVTNADRIRAMSGEELAKFLAKLDPRCSNCPADDICTGCSSEKGCVDWLQDWLRQPVKDGEGE